MAASLPAQFLSVEISRGMRSDTTVSLNVDP